MVKPFSVRELMLRVGAILRRVTQAPAADEEPVVDFGRLRVDRGGHHVWVDGQEVPLTALEFRLLSTFVARKGRVQTRETLLADVWGIEAEVTTRTVDTHVKRLREKLGAAGDYVETIRGVGYRFRDELP
jgi:two-component system phosphate regulon response regulator PhoB